MNQGTSQIAARIGQVKARIRQACLTAGRPPEDVTLVCVSKTVGVPAIQEALAAGESVMGENYGQHLRDKARELDGVRWHFIGPLQRNKVRYVVGTAELIHSVHSPGILHAINERAGRLEVRQDLLIQLNIAQEETKSGVGEQELETMLEELRRCQHCRCLGLMTMPPFFNDPEGARPYFRRLRQLAEQYRQDGVTLLRQLSMGMTGDFEVAIEEGATLVRVGTAIFGARTA